MGNIVVNYNELKKFCTTVFAQSIPLEEAEMVADNLVEADLLGFHSHGVCKVADYLKRLEDGLIEKKTDIQKITETATTAVYDANNGWGQYASVTAMEEAINKAKEYGTGFVGVKDSNHFGVTSYYTKLAAAHDCIGIATTNASGLMVPFGSKDPSLGTNPISFAVPRGKNKPPIVLDMSTGNTARGKITLAQKTGDSIPEGWAITIDGKPTTDPVKALEGYLLPMGVKGSGLAIIVDILSGVLTGSLFGNHVPRMYEDPEPQRLGHFFGAISIEGFMNKTDFYERVEDRVLQTTESSPMEGFEHVYMPGEIEEMNKEKQLQEGISISTDIFEELKVTGETYKIQLDDYITVKS